MISSSTINHILEAEYSGFKEIPEKQVSGYKVIRDRGENFYSVLTGLFRYKEGPIRVMDGYHNLYKGTKSYNEQMVGKTAIFLNKEDCYKFFTNLEQDDKFCIIKITLSRKLHKAKATNINGTFDIFVGSCIDKIERIDE